jgi:hypothetical protein
VSWYCAAVNRDQEFKDLSELLTGIDQVWDMPPESRWKAFAIYEDSLRVIFDTLTEGDSFNAPVFLSPCRLAL